MKYIEIVKDGILRGIGKAETIMRTSWLDAY